MRSKVVILFSSIIMWKQYRKLIDDILEKGELMLTVISVNFQEINNKEYFRIQVKAELKAYESSILVIDESLLEFFKVKKEDTKMFSGSGIMLLDDGLTSDKIISEACYIATH